MGQRVFEKGWFALFVLCCVLNDVFQRRQCLPGLCQEGCVFLSKRVVELVDPKEGEGL